MLAYSARKNRAKRMPLYSVWKPPVSSCSASGRSNGARLVSAIPPMKKITKAIGCTNANHTPCVGLRAHDADHAERAGHQDDAHQRHRHGDLVADQLGGSAKARQQRPLAVRGVAGQDDPVHTHRGDRHDIEQADVDVGDEQRHVVPEEPHVLPEGNDGVDDQGRYHRQDRREGEHPLIGSRRRDVLLQHQLHRVGDRLQRAVRAHAHRPEA